jgi:hypothetical protein
VHARQYRSPTGELAHLEHGRVAGPDRQLWWSVSLVRADGSVPPVAGQPPIVWFRTREQAREGYRARLVALRDAGWTRVE